MFPAIGHEKRPMLEVLSTERAFYSSPFCGPEPRAYPREPKSASARPRRGLTSSSSPSQPRASSWYPRTSPSPPAAPALRPEPGVLVKKRKKRVVCLLLRGFEAEEQRGAQPRRGGVSGAERMRLLPRLVMTFICANPFFNRSACMFYTQSFM